jgi:hypothetical protein
MEIKTIFDLPKAAPAVLQALPAEVLCHLQEQASHHAAEAARYVAILHSELTERYAKGLNKLGTSHVDDGDITVTIDVPKTVSWDQPKLSELIDTIKGWGEEPAEYIDTKLSVSETKFKAWPSSVRDLFEPARTVKAGKPKILLARRDREAA